MAVDLWLQTHEDSGNSTVPIFFQNPLPHTMSTHNVREAPKDLPPDLRFWNGVTGRKFPSVLTKAHRVLEIPARAGRPHPSELGARTTQTSPRSIHVRYAPALPPRAHTCTLVGAGLHADPHPPEIPHLPQPLAHNSA